MLAIGKACVFLFVPFELLTLTGNKLEEMFVAAGFARETVYVCGYSNMTEGYLAPVEEFAFGGYEVAGAAHWYNIPEASPESEPITTSSAETPSRVTDTLPFALSPPVTVEILLK